MSIGTYLTHTGSVLVAQLRFRLPLSAHARTAAQRFVTTRGFWKGLCRIYLPLFLELLAIRSHRSMLHHGNDIHRAIMESIGNNLLTTAQEPLSIRAKNPVPQLRLHNHDNAA